MFTDYEFREFAESYTQTMMRLVKTEVLSGNITNRSQLKIYADDVSDFLKGEADTPRQGIIASECALDFAIEAVEYLESHK